jgi:4-amino-4-deoxy-L-arabinose transferase-like glycosyltransferase
MTTRKFLLGILVLAFIVRVGAMVLLQSWTFRTERSFGVEEGEIAYALANGQGFSWPQTWRPVGTQGAMFQRDRPEPTAWKAPLNPAIIAVAFKLFGSYSAGAAVALELFQIVLSLLSCYVVFRLGRMIFDEGTGLIAAGIFALYPASIHFSVQKVEYGTLLTLLGLLLVEQSIVLSKRPSMKGSLLLGALAGVATLVNPVILAFFPFALLWLMWMSRSEWRAHLKYTAAIVGCCVAVMAPWLIRNYLVFDRFVFIKSNFARELVNANFPLEGRALVKKNQGALRGNDGQLSVLYNEKAMDLVLERPMEFLNKAAVRSRKFWTYLGENQGPMRLAAGAAYYPMLGLGIAGVWLARRRKMAELPLIYLLSMPIPFYLTWANMGRFRFPIEPVLVLFASFALASLLSRVVFRSPSSLALAPKRTT